MIAFTVAWVLSVGSLAFFGTLFPEGLDGGSRLGLCLIPWMALAGWPHSRRPQARITLVAIGLALAPLMLAVLTDQAALSRDSFTEFGLGVVFVFLLVSAAAAAGASRARQMRYGSAWLALVLLLPLLGGAVDWISGETPTVLAGIQHASPLDWAWAQATGGESSPWLPLALCALVLAIAASGPADVDESLST